MSIAATDVSMLAEEYDVLVQESSLPRGVEPADEHFVRLESALVRHADWTPEGAQELVCLARRYGVFMLRNALALAVAAGIEDGEGGF